MEREFYFKHIQEARLGDPMQFHSYELLAETGSYGIQLNKRSSTDANRIVQCLGLQTSPRVELEAMLRQIENKLPQSTLLSVGLPLPKIFCLKPLLSVAGFNLYKL
jgi:hypothetical protein